MKLPNAARARVGGKTWVKVTADSKAGKVVSAYLDAAELGDPSLLIAQNQKSGKVVETGGGHPLGCRSRHPGAARRSSQPTLSRFHPTSQRGAPG
ncbi:hypothetical protein [Amycolatopsis orientalis]|uniref:hypothetical protein n=1 Tax=Amycolatopsis orientalis TaxID=31958 RepID=UPI001319FDC2|nr:hypothetical protein [Amycolatopsis orientalis]